MQPLGEKRDSVYVCGTGQEGFSGHVEGGRGGGGTHHLAECSGSPRGNSSSFYERLSSWQKFASPASGHLRERSSEDDKVTETTR